MKEYHGKPDSDNKESVSFLLYLKERNLISFGFL
jgi:hypothetical protein